MLTGRCKQEFEAFFKRNTETFQNDNFSIGCSCCDATWSSEDIFDTLPKAMQYAYILEWLDSVGIYICVNITPITYSWVFSINKVYYGIMSKTRQEATKATIEKVNELYNDKYDKECSQ